LLSKCSKVSFLSILITPQLKTCAEAVEYIQR
jgi:hypothetical protein